MTRAACRTRTPATVAALELRAALRAARSAAERRAELRAPGACGRPGCVCGDATLSMPGWIGERTPCAAFLRPHPDPAARQRRQHDPVDHDHDDVVAPHEAWT